MIEFDCYVNGRLKKVSVLIARIIGVEEIDYTTSACTALMMDSGEKVIVNGSYETVYKKVKAAREALKT